MGLKEDFAIYSEDVKYLPEVSDEDKLILYGLYKQTMVGDIDTVTTVGKEPIMVEAWKAVKGKTKEEAMSEYVNKAKQLLAAAGFD